MAVLKTGRFRRWNGWPVFFSVLALGATEYVPDLHFTGACNYLKFLNGLVFAHAGYTATGSPFFKATTRDDYIYWDQDCGGGGDGEERWIVDSSVPSTTAMRDLDDDGVCDYYGRIDSKDKSMPPESGFWSMKCADDPEADPETRFVVLAEITTTSTSTTITSTTTTVTTTSTVTATTTTTTTVTTSTSTTLTKTSTTQTATTTTITWTGTSSTVTYTGTTTTVTTFTTTTTAMQLQLQGACPFKAFLNGLTFIEQGHTAIGAKYFKAAEVEQYLYYDEDCDGGGNGKARWIIDENSPNPTQIQDMDQDGACNYHARIDSSSPWEVPSNSTWKVWCGLGWEDTVLHLDETVNYTVELDWDRYNSMLLDGSFNNCSQKEYLSGQQFDYVGETASGAPYYKSQSNETYIYYDTHCSGEADSEPRWIIDNSAPDLTALSDLDGDSGCMYDARVKTDDPHSPPAATMWRTQCDLEDWQDVWMVLVRMQTTSTTTKLPDDTDGSEDTTSPHVVAGARGGVEISAVFTASLAALVALSW